jgi:hypothetical protein
MQTPGSAGWRRGEAATAAPAGCGLGRCCAAAPVALCLTRAAAPPAVRRWAQQLAGVDFIATLPAERQTVLDGLKGYRQQQRAELFVSKVLGLLGASQ